MPTDDTMLEITDHGKPDPDSTITIPNIRIMVERFYEHTRTDDLLGPIFNTKVADWDAHYEKMTRFWASATLRTGTYSGRPIEAHQFDDPDLLTAAHFQRWVQAFGEIVAEVFAPKDAAVFADLGRRMAISISTRLGVRGVEKLLDASNPA